MVTMYVSYISSIILFKFFNYYIICIIRLGTMIKLFKVKEKQRELAESANGKPPVKKQSAGELRLQKGFFHSSRMMIRVLFSFSICEHMAITFLFLFFF